MHVYHLHVTSMCASTISGPKYGHQHTPNTPKHTTPPICQPRPCLSQAHHWPISHTVRLAIAWPTAWHRNDSCQLCPSPLSSHSKTGHFVHICAHISTPMRPPDLPLRPMSFSCQDTYDYTVGIPWNCFRVRGLFPLAAKN